MTDSVGVVVPVHNEEQRLDACLRALAVAASRRRLDRVSVRVVVVLDSCSDASAAVAAAWQPRFARNGEARALHSLTTSARNVGVARAAGVAWLLRSFTGTDPKQVWLASTDADSAVPPHWLEHQVSLHRRGVDAWVGTVEVADWTEQSSAAAAWFASTYRPRPGHAHIHGTNLGLSAPAYLRSGGFPPWACSEDEGLVAALNDVGAVIYAGPEAPVLTSARRDWRAAGGFGHTLETAGRETAGRDRPSVA